MPGGGNYPGSEIDKLLGPMQLDSLTSLPASNPTNDLHNDWTLFPSDGNIGRNMSLTAGMNDIGGPLVRSETTSPEIVSTPGLDGGPSCYSTPSTICVETPLMVEQLDFPGFGTTSPTKPAETNSPDQTILCLLRSCKVSIRRARRARCPSVPLESLNDHRIMRILELDSLLIAQDPGKALRPLLDKWDINKSLGLPALGLPSRWKGIQAAVDYLRLLDAGPEKSGLHPIAERLGHVLLFLNYKELCKNPENHYSRLPGKSQTTSVLESILDCYTDDSRLSNPRQSRRNRITTYHLRRGEWWWRLAGNYGIGLFLTADSSLMRKMCNDTFIEPQIDVLVTLTLNTRPGSIRILNELESVVKLLVFGNITDDPRPAILDEKDGLLGKQSLAKVWAEDKSALVSQRIDFPWLVEDSKANAERGMTGFSDS
ncbi:serine-proline rich protein [Penicillium sp. IBT 35674x]|nr:serine-proline rich protein [Penicillium sp. IBT 35674x]